ncbi:MAG: carbonic anhydrase family protein [Salinivirgaceae bacterium]|nr:carbonic anhydrase family protein [Salinivirgaceae bacterium]
MNRFKSCLCTIQWRTSITHRFIVKFTDAADVTISYSYNCDSGMEFINNGHSIQINFTSEKQNEITVNEKIFDLKQFHFHCPSEHTHDNIAFDAEAHFVHVSDAGEISVLGVFIKEGAENEFLNKLITVIPSNTGNKSSVSDEICPGDIFNTENEYYVYEDSLTTPPCTEDDNWFVSRTNIEASTEQIEALKNAMPLNNVRPAQAINEREFGKLDE